MRHPAVVFGEHIDLFLIDLNRVGEPHILANPINGLHVSDRAMAKLLQAELFLILCFREVGMEVDPMFSRQSGRFPHQVSGDAERGTRRKNNLSHGPRFCIMVALDYSFAVRQDLVLAVGD